MPPSVRNANRTRYESSRFTSAHQPGGGPAPGDAEAAQAPAESRRRSDAAVFQANDSRALLAAVRPATVGGVYLHIPFCFHKCHYCDFYSIVDDRDRQRAFTDRLIAEARAAGEWIDGPIRTIFVGGGTPTMLAGEHWSRLLVALHDAFDLSDLTEFTVEANPETVTADLPAILAEGGVNRVSIGCQSFNRAHLRTLERRHEPANVARAMDLFRAAGIERINLDLIFAIPGQTLDDWRTDLDAALALGPGHLSAYGLMYEPNTPLTRKQQQGRIHRVDADLEAAMYRLTMQRLAAAGFDHYEISNWARGTDQRCRHNLLYWRSENWFALGPSASGHLDGVRWKNLPHLGRYLAAPHAAAHPRVGVPITEVERLDADAAVAERLMMWLRLRDGVPRDWLETHLNPDRRAVLEALIARGLLASTSSAVRLTDRGVMLADSVVAELL